MKNRLANYLFGFAFLFSLNTSAELQRLSIVPQTVTIAGQGAHTNIQTLCIDYYREVPTWLNTMNEPAYNQVYSEGDVIVKIDGIETDRSFSSLVQSENPLLLLSPTSNRLVQVSLNPDNPESQRITELEIEFKNSTEIGNLIDHRDTEQSRAIFETWGYDITQDAFWKRAQCLDILNSDHEINYESGSQLKPELKALCDKMYSTLDLNIFSKKTLKRLIDNNLIIVDNNGNLTTKSTEILEQTFYYIESIDQAEKLNLYSRKIEELKRSLEYEYDEQFTENQVFDEVNLFLKQEFYSVSSRLTDIKENNNKNLRDTIINGRRHVLMVAWKSDNFMQYIKNEKGKLSTYKSNSEFFKYPLFLTTKSDLELVVSESNLSSFDEEGCRTRIKQVLGLPPNSSNNIFVEFWVGEDDIFRPAVDSSLKSSLMFLKPSTNYIRSLAKFSRGSYEKESKLEQYPFTGLGYTWDYSPASQDHFGVSEFVLKENKIIYVRKQISTIDYVKILTTQ